MLRIVLPILPLLFLCQGYGYVKIFAYLKEREKIVVTPDEDTSHMACEGWLGCWGYTVQSSPDDGINGFLMVTSLNQAYFEPMLDEIDDRKIVTTIFLRVASFTTDCPASLYDIEMTWSPWYCSDAQGCGVNGKTIRWIFEHNETAYWTKLDYGPPCGNDLPCVNTSKACFSGYASEYGHCFESASFSYVKFYAYRFTPGWKKTTSEDESRNYCDNLTICWGYVKAPTTDYYMTMYGFPVIVTPELDQDVIARKNGTLFTVFMKINNFSGTCPPSLFDFQTPWSDWYCTNNTACGMNGHFMRWISKPNASQFMISSETDGGCGSDLPCPDDSCATGYTISDGKCVENS
ncbi:unnamed protein product [Caenorhabditis auriculariae]|uniref:PAN-3 domain-containing protein n=1 Tax=Caenorhabditis auriculariae TaxID=2777116 RepID=A0A8S1HX21_9PELO|nr:unnamed protein product [Caenorhabditis auriculariae]